MPLDLTQAGGTDWGDPENPRLITIQGDLEKPTVEIEGTQFAVGRHRSNDLVLDSDRVSRFHARLVRNGKKCLIQDLGSFNGTWLQGRRLDSEREYALQDQDTIQISDYRFLYLEGGKGREGLSTIKLDRDKISAEAEEAIRKFMGK